MPLEKLTPMYTVDESLFTEYTSSGWSKDCQTLTPFPNHPYSTEHLYIYFAQYKGSRKPRLNLPICLATIRAAATSVLPSIPIENVWIG